MCSSCLFFLGFVICHNVFSYLKYLFRYLILFIILWSFPLKDFRNCTSVRPHPTEICSWVGCEDEEGRRAAVSRQAVRGK